MNNKEIKQEYEEGIEAEEEKEIDKLVVMEEVMNEKEGEVQEEEDMMEEDNEEEEEEEKGEEEEEDEEKGEEEEEYGCGICREMYHRDTAKTCFYNHFLL